MTKAINESTWLNCISSELGLFNDMITMYCDNQNSIHLAKNNVYHKRSKHIDVRFHFVRDIIFNGKIKLEKVPTKKNHQTC